MLSKNVTGKNVGLYFVLPTILLIGLIIVYPLISAIILSVTDLDGSFIGLDNFTYLFSDPTFWQSFWNSVVYVGGSLFFQIVLGTFVGIVLNQEFVGKKIIRSIILIPWVIPGIVAATTWKWMYHTDFGIINYMFESLGMLSDKVGWLVDPSTVMAALIAVNTWKMVPFVAIMVLAGLQGIDKTLYEAASVDGANFIQGLKSITIPQLKPVLLTILLLLTIWGFNSITIIYTMTAGGPADMSLIMPIHIYRMAFEYYDFNLAAAESIFLFVILGSLITIYLKLFSPNNK